MNDLLGCLAAANDYVLNRSRWEMIRHPPSQTRAILPDLRIVCDLTVNRSVAANDAKRYGFGDVQKNDLRSMRLGNCGCVAQRLDRSTREINRYQDPGESNRWNNLRLGRSTSNAGHGSAVVKSVSSGKVHPQCFRRWFSGAFHDCNMSNRTIFRFSGIGN